MKTRRARPVDRAMSVQRQPKVTIRTLWVDKVKAVAGNPPGAQEPWYLTLPGSSGLDIQSLVDEGLLSLTEVNSIKEADQHKVVALESSPQAYLRLQKRFPGLRIRQADFRSLIHGEGQFKWPLGEEERFCRARVVNLDINAPLKGTATENGVVFPVLEWIRKLCQIHAKPPRIDWTLCLTLHGDIMWHNEVNAWMKRFVSENVRREVVFRDRCKMFLGEDLLGNMLEENNTDLNSLDPLKKQQVIMVLVPKIIARLVHNEGWRVLTEQNLRYGGGSVAPMVTWIVFFTWNQEAHATPDATYREALQHILENVGFVSEDGEIRTTE